MDGDLVLPENVDISFDFPGLSISSSTRGIGNGSDLVVTLFSRLLTW